MGDTNVAGTAPVAEGITNPPIDQLLDVVDSKYSLVIMAAKRARQINAYYSQLGEGLLVRRPAGGDARPGEAALHRAAGDRGRPDQGRAGRVVLSDALDDQPGGRA